MPPKPFPTHFLCIPLVTPSSRPQLSPSLLSFAADVAAETAETATVIPPSAIRPVGTLHLTLGVCSFPKNEGLEAAKDLLRSLKPREILASARREAAARTTLPGADAPKPDSDKAEGVEETEELLRTTLRGLASMQIPQKTSVLYAHPVDDRGVLQTFCEKLRGVFIDAGLMQEENRPLLLHATVLNTIYVKNPPGESGGGGGNKRKRGRRGEKLAFDARGLIDRYEDQVWMSDCPVGRIELCKMGAKKVDVDGVEDEVYEAVAEVEF
ncbi:kinase A anchor protein [Coniochaeta sp. 2T2.1]|nr:kinase A anchor protein [Coniochaeta sp. 2T2.1]